MTTPRADGRDRCPFHFPPGLEGMTKAEHLHLSAGVLASSQAGASLEKLTDARYLLQQAEEALAETVAAARADGASWADVGRALSISRQAAQQRFGSAVPR